MHLHLETLCRWKIEDDISHDFLDEAVKTLAKRALKKLVPSCSSLKASDYYVKGQHQSE